MTQHAATLYSGVEISFSPKFDYRNATWTFWFKVKSVSYINWLLLKSLVNLSL